MPSICTGEKEGGLDSAFRSRPCCRRSRRDNLVFANMKRHVLIYGIVGGVLIAGLKWMEYRYLIIEHSFEIYGALVAIIFAVLGIWLGLRLTKSRETIVVKEVPVAVATPFSRDDAKRESLSITRRE